jgi:predicted dehydrogenase
MKPLNWGILSTSKFAINHIIPAIRAGSTAVVHAIASRDAQNAQQVADRLSIPRHYGSYEELLADPNIDVIYNPLPNHLHVPWSLKALEAGKHVLCEKPLAMNSGEASVLLEQSRKYPDLKVMEAFMYRFHPQWTAVKELVRQGRIGALKSVHAVFTYFNDDPANIRNSAEMGGGGLMDIGCYCVSAARYLFEAEPDRVYGVMEVDPRYGVDWKASGVLQFGERTATFMCSTRLHHYQRVTLFGSDGYLEIDRPFNQAPDAPVQLFLVKDSGREAIEVPAANQYRLLVEAFCRAITDGTPVPTPLEDAVANMKVLDAISKG